MSGVTLLLSGANFSIGLRPLVANCDLFATNAALAGRPYRVRSSVPLGVFRQFLAAIEGKGVDVTNENVSGMAQLCNEFGFQSLSSKLSAFRNSITYKDSADAEARSRISALEERVSQQERRIAALEADLSRVARVGPELPQMEAGMTSEFQTLLPQAQMPAPPPARALDSRVVSDFPPLFGEFRAKRFVLLWRGSRDRFGASDFHGRCDGRANTLTLILDTNGNIFGGFTPLAWESPPNWKYKCDDSLKSFVFTLKNPHNTPARKFALRASQKQKTIYCDSSRGPVFGYNEIAVWDNCHTSTSNSTYSFGNMYTNDTGLDGKTFFTGSTNFTVREIEVFEITD
jgi:uncharacterized coiled-coil protein SlyX